MTDSDFDGADWRLICDLQQPYEDLYDRENKSHRAHQVNTVLNAGRTLFKLKTANKEVDYKKLFDEFEEWYLGVKYTEIYDFENYLKEVNKINEYVTNIYNGTISRWVISIRLV